MSNIASLASGHLIVERYLPGVIIDTLQSLVRK